MQDETTESPEPTTPGDEGASGAPVDATALAEEAKADIRQAAERQTGSRDSHGGRTATSTPTKYEADAITASRTPSRAAEQALEEALESEAQGAGAHPDPGEHPTAKEVAEEELDGGDEDGA